MVYLCSFFFQAEDGIRDIGVTGVQTCALPIYRAGFYCGRGVAPGRLTWRYGGWAGSRRTRAAILTTKDGALRMRRPSSLTDDQMRLRAGVPVAVGAEIGS